MKGHKKKATSLPASVKAAKKSESVKVPSVRINMEMILNARDRATVHPEEYQIGSFRAAATTLDAILKHLGVRNSEIDQDLETKDAFLFGIKMISDNKTPFGKVVICDPKGKVLETVTVAEG